MDNHFAPLSFSIFWIVDLKLLGLIVINPAPQLAINSAFPSSCPGIIESIIIGHDEASASCTDAPPALPMTK